MPFDAFPTSEIGEIDRQVEHLVSLVVSGDDDGKSYAKVGDLLARRVEMTEPAGFARIEELLGRPIPV